ncbi:MAG: KPN_02809 family neutral zinc metallopeptidase [Bryobacteraceae bacterium]
MKWTPGGESSDIEDRRDEGGGGGMNFGGYGPHLGIGGTLVLLVLSFVFKQNFFSLFSGGGSSSDAPATTSAPLRTGTDPSRDPSRTAQEKTEVQFVSFVLDDVQRTWDKLLPQQANVPYHHAKLVLFRDSTRSACGQAQEASGPFYCPGDEKVYIDLGFFDELKQRFGAPGEFAQAYVLAHEIGHHVQKLLGIEAKVRQLEERNPREQNPLSVRLELQADCYAGVWGNTTEQRKIIDESDVEAGLRAAAAVGDDRLQKMATGHVSPESFTHGSSAQRTSWFRKGLDSGRISACNTFAQ